MRIIPIVSLCLVVTCCKVEHKTEPTCECDTLKLKSELLSIPIDSTRENADFYEVDTGTNRQLWFTDIESIDSTQYTRLWDDYHEKNFRTSHREFKDHYKESLNTKLAFQIGPAGPLWTYYTFVLTKRECCFVFSRTSFAHARFRYKGYSILSNQKIDSLFDYIKTLDKTEVNEGANYMTSSFIDNINDEIFDVSIEETTMENSKHSPPDSSVIKFLNFIDAQIKWTETYPLEPEVVRPKFYDQFSISGSYIMENERGGFKGKVTVEKKEMYMYYTWDITSEGGKLLAAKSSTIDFKQMTSDTDQFNFVKKYVLREIREYKIRDKNIVVEITDPS